MEIITIAKKETGKEYIKRPAAYCLIFNDEKDKIAIIQTSDGNYFLPGGGIEKNETHQECLVREALEEMGMDIAIGTFIGSARRYFYSTNEYTYYLSEGYFYLCKMVKQIGEPTEEGHFLKWIEPNQAIQSLFHEHQSWAIQEALRKG
ncbi:NUDIX hydrolase [Niallia sp. FSL W8-0635]|uniref:NUDIX hydrolase n=1 Tax=Niallia sp. FSL W8-0635 TaxID=2975337 RepID=UPI0009C8F7C2|nr:GDP-mannose mannosyl hydrolase NudD [Mycobacteroides abscessus subsp. abscessus]HEO8418913.1 NUDIX domain-containing protein [Yersinia enterocolitica]